MLDPGLAELLRRIENWPNVVAEPRHVAAAAAARPAATITFHGDPPPVVPKVGDYGQLSSSLRAPNCRRTSLASSRPQRPTARDVLGPELGPGSHETRDEWARLATVTRKKKDRSPAFRSALPRLPPPNAHMIERCSTPSRWRTTELEQAALTGLLRTPFPERFLHDKTAAGHRDAHWGHVGFWSLEPQQRMPAPTSGDGGGFTGSVKR